MVFQRVALIPMLALSGCLVASWPGPSSPTDTADLDVWTFDASPVTIDGTLGPTTIAAEAVLFDLSFVATVASPSDCDGCVGAAWLWWDDVDVIGCVDLGPVPSASAEVVVDELVAGPTELGPHTLSAGLVPTASCADAFDASRVYVERVLASLEGVTPPVLSVVSRSPTGSEETVTVEPRITFDQEIDSSTVQAADFSIAGGSSGVTVTPRVSGDTVILGQSGLEYDTQYTVSATTGFASTRRLRLAQTYTWSFTTEPVPGPLELLSVSPSDTATDVPIDQTLVLTFNQDVDASSFTAADLGVTAFNRTPTVVSGTVAVVNGNTVTFTPTGGLWMEFGTRYDVAPENIRSAAGTDLVVPAPTYFNAAFLDSRYYYRLHAESSPSTWLGTYSDDSTPAYGLILAPGESSDTFWYFEETVPGYWGARNQYAGDSLWLSDLGATDGTVQARMSANALGDADVDALYSSQEWEILPWAPRDHQLLDGVSPFQLRMRTRAAASANGTLAMTYDTGNGYDQGYMGPYGAADNQLFWIERGSLR